MVAVPAMLGPVAIVHVARVVGIRRASQEIFSQIHGVAQVIIVHVADIDEQLSLQLGSQRRPISAQDVRQVVILFPVVRYLMIDLADELVPNRLGVTIGAEWGIHCLPDVPLIAGAALSAERQLAM